MKPDSPNGGEFREVATNAPGVRFSEHLPKLGQHADKLAIVRSLNTKEGDHERGSYLMRTGHAPMGPSKHPAVGASLAKHLALESDALPPYVSVAPNAFSSRGRSSGFLGPKYAPLIVNSRGDVRSPTAAQRTGEPVRFAELRMEGIDPPANISEQRMTRRVELWRSLQQSFLQSHPASSPLAHQSTYENALRVVHSGAATAFNLNEESVETRERYGRGVFGQGCLLARRLIESGVPFVEVSLNGWDTHANNFSTLKQLSAELDAGWATLMTELEERGLLASTTLLWMGEFGRTPKINNQTGRDHFPQAWSCVLAGGGIAGGQTYGRTSADGTKVEDSQVSATDVLATLCQALGVPPSTENISESGRPLKIVDGTPIRSLLS
jgi:hypothetical protein